MALERLGSSLHEALRKLFRVAVVDEAAVKELVRDVQRALLQADVNVQLVLDISKRIEERALKEKVPPGISRREHVIKVVYEELTRFLGEKPVPLKAEPGKRKVLMLTSIGSILITKLDGSARGGGALSAVVATGAPIKFISTGEKIEDIEPFVPSRFVGRLLGMGDIETLIEKVREAEVKVPEKKAKAMLSGKFTLTDMYEQFEAMRKMGPFQKILKMLPGMSYNIPEEMLEQAEDKLEKWRVIIQSMTPQERENPKIFNASRIRRVARGSGTGEKDVKELLKQYDMMRKMLKTLRRKKRLPFLGKGLPLDVG